MDATDLDAIQTRAANAHTDSAEAVIQDVVTLLRAAVDKHADPLRDVLMIVNAPSAPVAFAAMPVAITEFQGATFGTRFKLDLSNCKAFRLTANQSTAGSAGSRLRAEWSADQSAWASLEAAGAQADLDVTGTGLVAGSWQNIAPAAKGDVFVRIVGGNGNASASPAWRSLTLQTR